MSKDYADARVLMYEFAEALNALSGAERTHLLDAMEQELTFCKSCGYSDCVGNCERDE